jgi:hypothetical protein
MTLMPVESSCTNLSAVEHISPIIVSMSNSPRYSDDTSRKVIDLATGILVGLYCCSPREAFDELVSVMNHTGVGIGSRLWPRRVGGRRIVCGPRRSIRRMGRPHRSGPDSSRRRIALTLSRID